MPTVFENVDEELERHQFYLQFDDARKKKGMIDEIAKYLIDNGCTIAPGNPGFKVFLDPRDGDLAEVIFVEVSSEKATEDGVDIPEMVRTKLQEYADDYVEIEGKKPEKPEFPEQEDEG